MAIDFYSVKLRKSVSIPEENCTKKSFEFISKKKNKTVKRYIVCAESEGAKLSKFVKAEEYPKINCKEQN